MKVLVACEFSGIVRNAFTEKGHYAVSCDLLPTERPGNHYQGNVLDILHSGWDLMIAHPPCTHLATSGARWFQEKEREQEEALVFVRLLLDAPIHKIALENPVSIISSKIRPSSQCFQPWQFGHPEKKKTCLWLKNLPLLEPTEISLERKSSIMSIPAGPDRGHKRSVTFEGIAKAMADQWG
jgi:site-specific DNA-cytosine methylase